MLQEQGKHEERERGKASWQLTRGSDEVKQSWAWVMVGRMTIVLWL